MMESAEPVPEAMDELLRDRRELRRLVAHLQSIRDSERQQLAAQIHDDVIQAMTATSLRVQQLGLHLDRPEQAEMLAKVDDSLRDSITRLRRLMSALARAASPPGMLEQAGREP